MVSYKTINEIVFNSLEGIDVENLKKMREVTAVNITVREKIITQITDVLQNADDESAEKESLSAIKEVNEIHKILRARLCAIDRKLEEIEEAVDEEEEDEEEQFNGLHLNTDMRIVGYV